MSVERAGSELGILIGIGKLQSLNTLNRLFESEYKPKWSKNQGAFGFKTRVENCCQKKMKKGQKRC